MGRTKIESVHNFYGTNKIVISNFIKYTYSMNYSYLDWETMFQQQMVQLFYKFTTYANFQFNQHIVIRSIIIRMFRLCFHCHCNLCRYFIWQIMDRFLRGLYYSQKICPYFDFFQISLIFAHVFFIKKIEFWESKFFF